MKDDRHVRNQDSATVYAEVIRYKLTHGGIAPSIPDLVKLTGYNSTKPVLTRLEDLDQAGLIKRFPRSPRAIIVKGEQWEPVEPTESELLLVGPITRNVLGFIRNFAVANSGMVPTLSEIADAFEWRSCSTAKYHVDLLLGCGLIRRVGGHRSLVLPGKYTINLDDVPAAWRGLVSATVAETLASA